MESAAAPRPYLCALSFAPRLNIANIQPTPFVSDLNLSPLLFSFFEGGGGETGGSLFLFLASLKAFQIMLSNASICT